MATVAILGASGYSGQETLDRVLRHPELEVVALGSDSLAGRPAADLDFRLNGLLPAIATARARFGELEAVRDEVESLADALAARKAIERAKGILMQKDALTEEAAFARLRRASQVSGRPMRVIAEAVIQAFAT